MMARNWPAKTRHDSALCVGGFLARAGWDVDTIDHFMVAVQETAGVTDHSHVENGRKAAVDAATMHREDGKGCGFPALTELFGKAVAKQIAKLVGYREVPEPTAPSEDGRPVMKVGGGRLSDLADESEALLIEAGVPFYERSNTLARPIVRIVDTFHGTKTSVAQLARVDAVYARDILCRIAVWVRFDIRAKKMVRIDPPPDVAATLLARAGEWNFPTIAGIVTTPTMRPDGTIFDQPGYDPATRLLLIDPPPMAPIPENPTRADAEAALALLNGLLRSFPWWMASPRPPRCRCSSRRSCAAPSR